jgi:hypothetical protein
MVVYTVRERVAGGDRSEREFEDKIPPMKQKGSGSESKQTCDVQQKLMDNYSLSRLRLLFLK